MLSPVVQTRPGMARQASAGVRHTLYIGRWEGATPSYSVENAWPVASNATVLFKVVRRERDEALSTAAWMCTEIAHARAASLAS